MSDEKDSLRRDAEIGGENVSGSLVTFPGARKQRPPDNLPRELSSFVGREVEISQIERILAGDTRLLTLYGSGGSGKTRLALAVTQEMVESFDDGVWWVGLAPLSDPDLVAGTLSLVLGVREVPDRPFIEALAKHLEPMKALIVLDNCEHLIEGCAALADALLRSCPDLRILATSREPLRVAGESIWMVPSLSLPDPQQRSPDAEELAGYEAVRLFVERAEEADAGFAITERNAAKVASLCRKLDGIPLAIELAAARVRALTVEQIYQRLENPLGLLTTGSRTAPPRQRTLRAALEWSWELLEEQEQELLGRLSVFVGGWDLEAAEAVGAEDSVQAWQVLDLLSMLMDKSLVVAEKDGEEGLSLRYRMLEPVRQYARERLRESAEEPEVLRRHAGHYLALAERADPELLGPDQGRWIQRLRTEAGNLRGALSWSLEAGQEEERAELRLRMVAAMGRFWNRESFEEGTRWLRVALEKDPGVFPATRAKTLAELGFILLFQQNYDPAVAALDEAVALYKGLDDRTGAAYALANLGWAVMHGYYRERVLDFVREGEALMEGGLEAHPRAYLSIILGVATVWRGDLDLAASRVEEAAAMNRELGNLRDLAMTTFNLGGIYLKRGDIDRAMQTFEEGARISGQLGDVLGAAYYVWIYGDVNARLGRPVRAAKLWGAAEVMRDQMGMSFSRYDLAESGYEGDLAAVRAELDEVSFDAAWAEGRSMSLPVAVAYALDEPVSSAERPEDRSIADHAADEGAGGGHGHILPTMPRKEEAPFAGGTDVLRIFALGPEHVERDGQPLEPSPDWILKPRELLFYLLCHPRGRTKEQIGLALWPEASTSQLRSSFHDTAFRLRRALGAKEWVHFEKGRYSFGRSLAYYFDVEDFEHNLAEARRLRVSDPRRAIGYLQEAVRLYGGDFLEDSAEGEWAYARQDELRREYGETLLVLGELLCAQERYAEAAEVYRKAIAHDGLVEEAHRGLMRSQAAMGERGRALKHYEELAVLLDHQLGTSPALETAALYKRLRAGEEV